MNTFHLLGSKLALVIFSLTLSISTVYAQQSEEAIALAKEVAALAAEVQALEDENEIENLQRIFGFYIDKRLWAEAANLFAENGTIEISGEGVYASKARVLEYLQSLGAEGPEEGILNDHMQLQPVIHVLSTNTAKGRWHHFSQEAKLGESDYWGTGIYENDYVKEEGVWKIQSLHLFSTMRTPYADGWAVTALPRTEASTSLPPDSPATLEYENYPAVFVVPFHYENPVSGSPLELSINLDNIDESLATAKATLASLDNRIGLLQDADDVEYLHTVYGYYLARYQMDDLAGIFSEDGTIEIALRGVYVGQESVRNNLDLYPLVSLHNHMQYQPVIHVAEDGNSALMRSRAFSIMGSYETTGLWMGGVYENEFVKRDGVWKMGLDHVYNTYFINYNTGWKDTVWRPAPGISEDNPPDEPPTTYFEMYPSAFLPEFHYTNPVTGE